MKILDANYEKADLPSIVENNCLHLSLQQRTELLNLLMEFEKLFDRTLGEWDTDPVSLELKDGTKPYSYKLCPVPRLPKICYKKKYKDCVILEYLDGSPGWSGLHHHS